jgi:hypothetical protein
VVAGKKTGMVRIISGRSSKPCHAQNNDAQSTLRCDLNDDSKCKRCNFDFKLVDNDGKPVELWAAPPEDADEEKKGAASDGPISTDVGDPVRSHGPHNGISTQANNGERCSYSASSGYTDGKHDENSPGRHFGGVLCTVVGVQSSCVYYRTGLGALMGEETWSPNPFDHSADFSTCSAWGGGYFKVERVSKQDAFWNFLAFKYAQSLVQTRQDSIQLQPCRNDLSAASMNVAKSKGLIERLTEEDKAKGKGGGGDEKKTAEL